MLCCYLAVRNGRDMKKRTAISSHHVGFRTQERTDGVEYVSSHLGVSIVTKCFHNPYGSQTQFIVTAKKWPRAQLVA